MGQTFTSAALGFSVDYPTEFVVLPEPSPLPVTRPPLLARVRFQTRSLAGSEFADREPPKLSIQVFQATGASLRDWLRSFDRVPASAEVLPFSVAGAREAVEVADRRQLAPNTVFYVLANQRVFALTPLDDTGMQMVRTFRLVP
jgi:hypothetical protein